MLPTQMQVTFTYSQEEMVDAAMRFLARSKTIRTTDKKNTIAGVVLSGLMVFLLAYLTFKSALFGSMLGLFAARFTLAISPSSFERSRRKTWPGISKRDLVTRTNCLVR